MLRLLVVVLMFVEVVKVVKVVKVAARSKMAQTQAQKRLQEAV